MADKKLTRSTQLVGRKDVRDQLTKVFSAVEKGFDDQSKRADEGLDFWEMYNCVFGTSQNYHGNSRLCLPLVHNAVEAIKTRFFNQIFPQAGRYIDVTTEDGEIPHAEMALLEMYIEQAAIKDRVVPPMLVAGQVEGQYTVCVTWGSRARHVVSRETKPMQVGGIEHPGLGHVEKLDDETVTDAGPAVDIIADPDFLVLPATSDSIDEALAVGGSVTAICRWTQSRLQKAIDDGEIAPGDEDNPGGTEYLAQMLAEMADSDSNRRDVPKKLADAAGIRAGGKFAVIYRTWTVLDLGKKIGRRLCLAYYGGDKVLLGCKLCPYWNDRCDYISEPVKKMPGVFKGMSPVKPCADMQYAANDAINEGMDSATYSLLPIIMTDPVKNPKVGTMVMDLMAVWETSPNDTKPLEFPQLYQHAFNIVAACEQKINQTLGVNPAMMPQSTGTPGRKRNQAEVALEQQVDLLTTDVGCTAVENVLTQVLQRFADYDNQFRDDEITVRSIGELGVKAQMETIGPAQLGKRWRYVWRGTSAKNTVQQIQQQISALNVIGTLSQSPAVAQAGYRMNPIPLIKTIAENAFGPRDAPQIFVSIRDELSIDPEMENQMLVIGHEVMVSPMDDDPKHLQAHMMGIQQHPEIIAAPMSPPAIAFKLHIMAHQKSMQMKQAQQMMQQQQAAAQAGPPGQKQLAGPRPGATPQPPRGGQNPPGAIHADQMRGGLVQMPRRAG